MVLAKKAPIELFINLDALKNYNEAKGIVKEDLSDTIQIKQ